MLVAILILVSGYRVTKDSVHVLMEGNPETIQVNEVRRKFQELPGVLQIHDLHLWSITSDFPALSAHLVVSEETKRDQLLKEAKDLLEKTFHIEHSTLQLEGETVQCRNGCN